MSFLIKIGLDIRPNKQTNNLYAILMLMKRNVFGYTFFHQINFYNMYYLWESNRKLCVDKGAIN